MLYSLEWVRRLLSSRLEVTEHFIEAKGNVLPFGKRVFSQDDIEKMRYDLLGIIFSLEIKGGASRSSGYHLYTGGRGGASTE